jgi:tricorn protease interacting factor F2/3
VPARVLEYELALDIDTAENTFRGVVQISGIVAAGPVELDSVDLTIESVQVGDTPIEFELDDKRNKLTFSRPSGGSERVRIAYSGKAGRDVQTGLFVSRLGSAPALSTQMEPESCRRLLPCFDQPDKRAVFRLEVTIPEDLVAISNMPSETRVTPDHRARWVFSATPPMSTYLLYLGVGPFEETIDDDGPTLIIVAGPAGHRPAALRTSKLARAALRGFGEYFDIPFPLPKLHFVALSDFWAGMENWGAISGSVFQYLLDEGASPSSVEYSDQTIVHQTAHQWFGDLVTLRTWDDLWLNEAFATFATSLVQERTHIREDAWAEFRVRNQPALRFDALRASHPVKPESYDAAEIMGNADEITYYKGAQLIRMIQKFVGEDGFRDGITEYLNDHRFGNAESDDLWTALEEESEQPVTKVMRAWVERAGHPCLTVRQDGPDVELRQHRFLLVPDTDSGRPWPIPVTVEEDGRRTAIVFENDRLRLPGRNARQISIDPGRDGFFRVLWSPELRAERIASLPTLSPGDRHGFCLDAEGFLLSGDYSVDEYARVLDAVRSATDRMTVEGVLRSLDYLHPILSDVPRFTEAARAFCATQTERLGERSTGREMEGADIVREWAFWMRARIDPEFSATLAPRVESLDQQPSPLRLAILSSFARHGGEGSVTRLLSSVTGPSADASTTACFALGETPDIEPVLSAFRAESTAIPLANFGAYLVPSLARTASSRGPLWAWMRESLHDVERRSAGSTILAVMCSRTLPRIGIGRAEELRQYFEKESFAEGRPGIRRGLELLEAGERMRARAAGAG